ncbi:hypothetical protein [Enterococcus sp. AZ072]
MKKTTYKGKKIDQEKENLRKQIQQTKMTKQKIEDLKRQQQLRRDLEWDR